MPSCGRRQRRPCGNARRFSRAAEATAPSRGALNSSLLAADLSGVSRLVLGQGLRDTRTALVRWNGKPGPIVRAWLGWSVAVAGALLAAVYVIAAFSPPDPTPLAVPGVTHAATLADVRYVLFPERSRACPPRARLRRRLHRRELASDRGRHPARPLALGAREGRA